MTKVDDAPKARLEKPAHPVPKEARKRPFIVEFYGSAVAKKWLMAITGIMLMGFVFAHMVGNLKMYLGADDLNHYAEWLRDMGEPALPRTVLLWAMRIGLIAAFVDPHRLGRAADPDEPEGASRQVPVAPRLRRGELRAAGRCAGPASSSACSSSSTCST